MKRNLLVAAATLLFAVSANATIFGGASDYDKKQDTQINSLKDRDAQLAADIHTVHMNTLDKYSESWGLEDRANIAKLQDQKLDKSVFTADQARQDKALADSVKSQAQRDANQDEHINAVQSAAQIANDRASNLEVRADGLSDSIKETNAQVEVTDQRSQNNAVRIDGVEQVNDKQDKLIASKVDTSVFKADQQRQDEALSQETSDRISGDAYANSRIDQTNAYIEANRQASVATNKRVAAHTKQLANHEQRLGKLESGLNSTNKEVQDNKQKADAAVSAVAAMANIPQVTESARFSAGVGLGTRGSQQAIAVGMSSRLSDSVVGKLSVANDTESQWTAGVGLAVQW
ncbi:hypothetical protein MIF8_93 [Erwinia phage MIF8]